jgi:hypothetical protein
MALLFKCFLLLLPVVKVPALVDMESILSWGRLGKLNVPMLIVLLGYRLEYALVPVTRMATVG